MTASQEFWRIETVSFYAIQSIHGVGYKTLYNIAASGILFSDLFRKESLTVFEKTLRIKLKIDYDNPSAWLEFKNSLWLRGLDIARNFSKKDIKVVFYNQDSFPESLKSIKVPPMWLFVQGAISNLHIPSVAVIGSRKCSSDGLWLTKFIISCMEGLGYASVSGLAEGVDQAAHIESLKHNIPTIAVLGTGIDSNYPSNSDNIRQAIIDAGGTIITEYLVGQSYSAFNFVHRNRLQAGLSQITIPVEWNLKSGTAHTVGYAKDFNRYVLMPYLSYQTDNVQERAHIDQYSNGISLAIPRQAKNLIDILSNPEQGFAEIKGNYQNTTQYSFDL